MRDKTQWGSESDKHASPMRDAREERKSHTLTLTPDDQLMGLSVYQIDQPHQQTLVQLAETTAKEVGLEEGIRGCAIFRKPRILLTFSEPLRRRIILGFPRFRYYDLVAASSYDDV